MLANWEDIGIEFIYIMAAETTPQHQDTAGFRLKANIERPGLIIKTSIKTGAVGDLAERLMSPLGILFLGYAFLEDPKDILTSMWSKKKRATLSW